MVLHIEKYMVDRGRQRLIHLCTALCVRLCLCTPGPATAELLRNHLAQLIHSVDEESEDGGGQSFVGGLASEACTAHIY